MTAQVADVKLAEDLKSAIREGDELIRTTAGHTGEGNGGVGLKNRLTAALESAKATCEKLEEKTVAAAKATDRTIRAHPYESIGVAFGIGLLIGVLVARK